MPAARRLYLISLRQQQDVRVEAMSAEAGCKMGRREAICCGGCEPGGCTALASLKQPLCQALIWGNGCQVQWRQADRILQICLRNHIHLQWHDTPLAVGAQPRQHFFFASLSSKQVLIGIQLLLGNLIQALTCPFLHKR